MVRTRTKSSYCSVCGQACPHVTAYVTAFTWSRGYRPQFRLCWRHYSELCTLIAILKERATWPR